MIWVAMRSASGYEFRTTPTLITRSHASVCLSEERCKLVSGPVCEISLQVALESQPRASPPCSKVDGYRFVSFAHSNDVVPRVCQMSHCGRSVCIAGALESSRSQARLLAGPLIMRVGCRQLIMVRQLGMPLQLTNPHAGRQTCTHTRYE